MRRTKDHLTSIGLLLLRVGAGALLLFGHGLPKLLHWSERVSSFANPIGLGSQVSFSLVVFAEVVCAAAVVLGIATRLAAGPIIFFLLVAAFVQNGPGSFSDKELALVYLVPFVTLTLTGGGHYALDTLILRGRAGRRRL
jgi:putative oxidoreductase